MSMEWVIDYGFQTIITGVVAYLIAQGKAQRKKAIEQRELDNKQLLATQAGVKALLKDRLISAIHKAKKQGFVYIHELENINSMFKEYSDLGGNGTIKHMMNEVADLPTKTDLN